MLMNSPSSTQVPAGPHADASLSLAQLADNPVSAGKLREIKASAQAMLEQNIAELVTAFGACAPRAVASTVGVTDVRLLATASRHATAAALGRRKLARDVLVAAITNRNNPAWDLSDPASWRDDPEDALVALMRMPVPG
jgi:hypothetical protein